MQERYEKIYQSLDYGPIGTARGLAAAMFVTSNISPCKTLCVGAGNSYEAVWLYMNNFNVTTYDYHHPKLKCNGDINQVLGNANCIPFKDNSFDMLICCEMLEHIPESDINAVLSELNRLSLKFELTIDDRDDPPYHTHLTIKPKSWWEAKLIEHNFIIDYFGSIDYEPVVFSTSYGERLHKRLGYPDRGSRISAHKII